jgi:hypothetical protein
MGRLNVLLERGSQTMYRDIWWGNFLGEKKVHLKEFEKDVGITLRKIITVA